MSKQVAVFVCDSAATAADAKKSMVDLGMPAGNITVEPVDFFNYDAKKFDGGSAELLLNKFVVIGRM